MGGSSELVLSDQQIPLIPYLDHPAVPRAVFLDETVRGIKDWSGLLGDRTQWVPEAFSTPVWIRGLSSSRSEKDLTAILDDERH